MWHVTTLVNAVLVISLRYFILAGTAFLVWYGVLRKKAAFRKIQLKFPANGDYRREILYSISTIILFSGVFFILFGNDTIRKHTTYYTGIRDHGLFYFWSAFLLMLVIHDAYFYWTHRLMHHPSLFRRVHLLHHRSTNPSPWAAFAFHPLEAVVEVGIIVVFLFTIPVCRIHLFMFFLFLMAYNVYGHLGWELYPKGFQRSRVGRWINTSINHNQHHQHFRGNYGLYFLWWDRWMGTLREDYDRRYDEVTSRTAGD